MTHLHPARHLRAKYLLKQGRTPQGHQIPLSLAQRKALASLSRPEIERLIAQA